jgi:dihydroxyacetone kinase
MTKMFNDPTQFKEEFIDGFTRAYGRYVRRVPDAAGVMALNAPQPGKVTVLIGGGSGHYPVFTGYVGRGMADVAVIGDVFTSPSGEQVYRCTKAAHGGAGVMFAYGNYSGDVLNFNLAARRLAKEGIEVRTVRVTDDVASAPAAQAADRRGIAGDFYVIKVAGASAARGDSLDDVEALTQLANRRMRSFGVAFSGCRLPGQHQDLFTVEPGRMEIGLGLHGEPGIRSTEMLPASGIAKLMVDTLLADAPTDAGNKVAVLLNGLGSTKYEELFVLYKDIARQLEATGLALHDPFVGEAATSLNMAGCSLTLLWLNDDLQALHDAPASTPGYTRL